MSFKKSILVFLLFLISQLMTGQITKFKSSSYAYSVKNENTGSWSKWSDLEETEVLITVDLSSDRIKIFSKMEQVYDIIKYYDKEVDKDGDETLKFHCVNDDGLKCYVRFVILNSRNGRRQLYVDFADMMWVYNIYKLE